MEKQKKHIQFSKIITAAFAIVMIPISAYVVWKCLDIAELAVQTGFMGALPYITAIVGFVEATIGAVYALYHSNSKTEKKVLSQSSIQTSTSSVQTTVETVQNEEYHTATNYNIDY